MKLETDVIKCVIENHVALVTMDNPPVNAQSQEFHDQMKIVFDTIGDMSDVRVAVLTGAGKIFSAGADIKSRAGQEKHPGDQDRSSRRGRETFHCVLECDVPVIGALNGPALGAGLAVAASCDILIASQSAQLGLPEINVGLLGGGRHAMRLFGHSLTRRMMFLGYRVPAEELYRLGVVEAVVPNDQLIDTAMQMALEIASKSPIAMRLAKHSLNTIEFMSLRDGYRFEQSMTGELGKYEDSKEAMRAFVEKREPVFKGH